MHKIDSIEGSIVKDSRGKDTLFVTVRSGTYEGSFSVPSGASTGTKEAVALPADTAISQLKEVTPKLLGHNLRDQFGLDEKLHELDGDTDNFSNLGGNVALGISVANAKAAAASHDMPLWQYFGSMGIQKGLSEAPLLVVNLINGGKHATQGSPVQEHQIIPNTTNAAKAYDVAKHIQSLLREIALDKYEEQVGMGDEGGLEIPSTEIETPFDLINEAIEKSDSEIEIIMGTDVAASSFYMDGSYQLPTGLLSSDELIDLYGKLIQRYSRLKWFEDPLAESDWDGFVKFNKSDLATLTIGDDLTVTNENLLQQAIQVQAVNALIIKPNQIGTLSDTLKTINLAHKSNIKCIVSHRSGETNDTLIADLAYGLSCHAMKAGAPGVQYRQEKYDRLLEITS